MDRETERSGQERTSQAQYYLTSLVGASQDGQVRSTEYLAGLAVPFLFFSHLLCLKSGCTRIWACPLQLGSTVPCLASPGLALPRLTVRYSVLVLSTLHRPWLFGVRSGSFQSLTSPCCRYRLASPRLALHCIASHRSAAHQRSHPRFAGLPVFPGRFLLFPTQSLLPHRWPPPSYETYLTCRTRETNRISAIKALFQLRRSSTTFVSCLVSCFFHVQSRCPSIHPIPVLCNTYGVPRLQLQLQLSRAVTSFPSPVLAPPSPHREETRG